MEKIKLTIKNNISFFIIFIFCLFLVVYWFSDQKIIASGEDGLFLFNTEKSITVFSSTWLDIASGFATSNYLPRLPFIYFVHFLSNIGLEGYIYQAVIFFILMFIGCIFQYKLTSFLFKKYNYKVTIGTVAAFLYLINPYSLTQLWNRQLYSQYFLFALLPVTMYFYIKGLRERKYTNLIFLSIFSFIFSTAFGLITNVIVLWTVIGFFTLFEIWFTKVFCKNIKYFLITLLVFISTNLWWIMPFVEILSINSSFSLQIDKNLNIETLEGLKKYLKPEYVSRLLQGYYFYSSEMKSFYSSNFVNIVTNFSLIFIIFSIYILRKDRSLYFLIFLALIGLCISIGSNEPTRVVFMYFFERIPFFQAFRNPYEKYGIVYMISFVIFLSYFLSVLKRFKIGNLLICIFLISYTYINFPVFSLSYLSASKIDIPQEIHKLNEEMSEISDKKFLVLPIGGEGHETTWNYDGVDSSLFLFDRDTFSYVVNTPILEQHTKEISDSITFGKDLTSIASLNEISHIIIRKDIVPLQEVNLDFERIQKNAPKEVRCKSLELDIGRITGKNTFTCKMNEVVNIENSVNFYVADIDVKDFEINLIDENNKRIIFRQPNPGNYEMELANQIEDGFLNNSVKEILLIVDSEKFIKEKNLTFYFIETTNEFRPGRYSKVWENNLSEIYKIYNVDFPQKELIEIDRNSYFVLPGKKEVLLNKTYNSGWVLVNTDKPMQKNNLVGMFNLYISNKVHGIKPEVSKKYFNTWKIDENNSYQISFLPDVSFIVGVYLSFLSFLVLVFAITVIVNRKKTIRENFEKIL
jgi:hypothetical protein